MALPGSCCIISIQETNLCDQQNTSFSPSESSLLLIKCLYSLFHHSFRIYVNMGHSDSFCLFKQGLEESSIFEIFVSQSNLSGIDHLRTSPCNNDSPGNANTYKSFSQETICKVCVRVLLETVLFYLCNHLSLLKSRFHLASRTLHSM